ncbi:Dehydrogenase [Marinicrinis lubricantis]
MTSSAYPPANKLIQDRLNRIFDPYSALCKEDVLWILDYVKKRVADEDPKLLALSQPRLLKNFHYFAEIAMMLIHQRSVFDQELDRIKLWLQEALYGLQVDDPSNAHYS